jgi:hypothetical protein
VPDLYSNQAGQVNALNLVLHMPYIESDYSFKDEYGAHLYVSNKSMAKLGPQGIDINVNQDTSVVVTRQFSTTLASPFGDCVVDTTNYGSVFTNMFVSNNMSYSQSDCFKYNQF